MSEIKLTISLKTKIPLYWVAVDDQDVLEPPKKKSTIKVTVDKEHYLSWWFAGDTGSPYEIELEPELEPPPGYEVIAVGALPVKRSIASNRYHSADTLRFYVVKK